MKKYRKKNIFIVTFCIALSMNGCNANPKFYQKTTTQEISEIQKISEIQETSDTQIVQQMNKEEINMLMELLGCDEAHATKIEDEFQKVTEKKIEHAELISTKKKSSVVKVETDDKIYYLKITSLNMLREIRADKEDGKILYQIVY